MTQLINELRDAYATINRIDPCGDSYKKLTALLDRADDRTLKILRDADINFVSALARNRCALRGIK
jgi:hypothetical protein